MNGIVESKVGVRSSLSASSSPSSSLSRPWSSPPRTNSLPTSTSLLATPTVDIRPTSAMERHRMDSMDARQSTNRIWASIPELDHAAMMQELNQSRGPWPRAAAADAAETRSSSAGDVSPQAASRVGSAQSKRHDHTTTGYVSVTRTRCDQSAATGSTSSALIASVAQQKLSDAFDVARPVSSSGSTAGHLHQTSGVATQSSIKTEIEDSMVATSSPPRDLYHPQDESDTEVIPPPPPSRPQSVMFLSSLHNQHLHGTSEMGTSSMRVRVLPHSASSQRGGHAKRRNVTAAPISLLKSFESRVRNTSTYSPVELIRPSSTLSAVTTRPDSRLVKSHESTCAATATSTPPSQCTVHDPALPFHKRGEYVDDVSQNVLDRLGYFSFERQQIEDIYERNERQKEMIEFARRETAMMSLLRSKTLKEEMSFWKSHRAPNCVDLNRLLPGRGGNTREVKVFVGKLLDGEHPPASELVASLERHPSPSSSPPPVQRSMGRCDDTGGLGGEHHHHIRANDARWTNEERKRFQWFMGVDKRRLK